jgi:hypothetical protein
MPENCQMTASMLIGGIIQGVCRASDLPCILSARKVESPREDRIVMEYLIEIEDEVHAKWDRK